MEMAPVPTTWHVPPDLLRLQETHRIRGEPMWAYVLLYQFAEHLPRVMKVNYGALALVFGATERSARRWITTLADAGLIEIERHVWGGVIVLIRHWLDKPPGSVVPFAAPPRTDARPQSGGSAVASECTSAE